MLLRIASVVLGTAGAVLGAVLGIAGAVLGMTGAVLGMSSSATRAQNCEHSVLGWLMLLKVASSTTLQDKC